MLNFDVITKDQDVAKKLLIGSLLVLTGFGVFALLGWTMEIMRRVDRGEGPSLPDFDNIGEFFIDGLKISAVAFIWSLPITLIVVVLTVLITILPASGVGEDFVALVVTLLTLCMVGFIFLTVILITVLMVPAMGILADTGSLKDALNIQNAFRLARANFGGILVAALLTMLFQSVLSSIGALFCVIGVFPAAVISYALQGQFFGKAYVDAKANLGDAMVSGM